MQHEAETSFIGRWVAFLILPLATALATLVGVKAKAWFGVDLDTGEVAAWIISVAVGIAVWLFNRGKYEAAKVTGLPPDAIDAIVQKVIEEKFPTTLPPAGQAPTTPRPPPATPGGLSSGQ